MRCGGDEKGKQGSGGQQAAPEPVVGALHAGQREEEAAADGLDVFLERLAIGQWGSVVGYAGLPWLVVAAERFRDRPRAGLPALVLWLGTGRVDRPVPGDSLAADDSTTPVVYAFVQPESYGETLLPDDYAALADVLGLDGESR